MTTEQIAVLHTAANELLNLNSKVQNAIAEFSGSDDDPIEQCLIRAHAIGRKLDAELRNLEGEMRLAHQLTLTPA